MMSKLEGPNAPPPPGFKTDRSEVASKIQFGCTIHLQLAEIVSVKVSDRLMAIIRWHGVVNILVTYRPNENCPQVLSDVCDKFTITLMNIYFSFQKHNIYDQATSFCILKWFLFQITSSGIYIYRYMNITY